MGITVSVESLNSCLARYIITQYPDGTLNTDVNIKGEGEVYIESACIEHDMMNNNRPYLMLYGQVLSIKGNLPHNTSFVNFSKNQPNVVYNYQLTDKELATLCEKGLFNDGFKCPDIFYHNTFELPLVIDCSYSALTDANTPILFIDIKNQYDMEIDSKSSGYSITDYFDEYDKTEPELGVVDKYIQDQQPKKVEPETFLDFDKVNDVEPVQEEPTIIPEDTPQTQLVKSNTSELFNKIYENVVNKKKQRLSLIEFKDINFTTEKSEEEAIEI